MHPTWQDDDDADIEKLTLAQRDESELRDLEQRLDRLKDKPVERGNKTFARGVALLTSMGFVLGGCLVGGFLLGDYAAKRAGYQAFMVMGLLLGLVAAVFALVKLMRPFLQGDD